MSQKNWDLELVEYIKIGEPEKKEKAKTWETAIGLQDVEIGRASCRERV